MSPLAGHKKFLQQLVQVDVPEKEHAAINTEVNMCHPKEAAPQAVHQGHQPSSQDPTGEGLWNTPRTFCCQNHAPNSLSDFFVSLSFLSRVVEVKKEPEWKQAFPWCVEKCIIVVSHFFWFACHLTDTSSTVCTRNTFLQHCPPVSKD